MVRDQVIIGDGMIGRAMADVHGLRGTVVYAAGVSNSACVDEREFNRERQRLTEALQFPGLFIYFSTCSEEDRPYTHHKRAMEGLVKARGSYLIARLSIVAGKTPNPHTLLNFLYSRVARSERFTLRTLARRNVIDVRDVARVVDELVRAGTENETVNVAAPEDYGIREIVREFERICRKPAIVDCVDEGDAPLIDTRRIADTVVDFSGDYLARTLRRYYA